MRLPYPPLLNHYKRWFCTRSTKHDRHPVRCGDTTLARHYKVDVIRTALVERVRPMPGELRVVMHVYRPRRTGDLDGTMKVLFDALQGCMYENDSQIAEIHAYRHEDKADPRVEIEIEQIEE